MICNPGGFQCFGVEGYFFIKNIGVHMNNTAGLKLYSIKDIVYLTGISSSTIRRSVKRGEFPPPVPVSKRRKAWLERDYQGWLEQRRAA
jgi:predicted DNA-binding transcriptional regulator AlpA